ncbi:MAG: Stp1/IreP family PP2C-type Ser/Thr phosphatase [Ignavibacterium sp.]|nr:Stp1/IreP family PP2C-type Ser/Thr phosphatase [Ignavibacterium sp.]
MSETQKLYLEYSGLSDIGMVRTENQDSYGKFPEDDLNLYTEKGQLFIVADGMGGHTGGKQASNIAVETVCNSYAKSDHFNLADALHSVIVAANTNIYQASGKSTELSRMGTTCTVLLLQEDKGIIGHVGDSRVYRIENGKIEQLTEDHTQVQAMLKEGVLTPAEAKVYPSRSVLARALGVEEKVKVDIIQNVDLRSGQAYLLCSDGLAKITESEILKIISENPTQIACKQLVELANERGGKDNVTVQVIKIGVKKSAAAPVPEVTNEPERVSVYKEPKPKKSKTPIIAAAVVILLLIAGYTFKDSITSIFSSSDDTQEIIIPPIVDSSDQSGHNDTDEKYKDLLMRADKLFQNGRLETALDLYREILDEAPMNFSAIQGINQIALSYLKTADEKMADNNFEDALNYYYKVKELQPENERVHTLIKICENQINYGTPDKPVEIETLPLPQPGFKETGILVVNNFTPGEWNFLNLPSNQYSIDNKEIEFTAGSFEKKSVFRQELVNAEVSIEIKANLPDNKSMVGLIVGYNQTGNIGREEYYLLNCQKSGFSLQKISGSNSEQLTRMNAPQLEGSGVWKLKILSSNNRIHIFSDTKLLGNWEGPDKISGKVGLIAGPDVHAKFTNLHIRGTRK